MKHKNDISLSGELLVADFQSALAALATAEYAQSEAQHTENAVVSELQSFTNQTYLNPASVSPIRQNDISKASLNAHVMKVQAAQLQRLSQEQLNTLQQQVSSQYIGQKVVVSALDDSSPFDSVWFNNQTGYRSNTYSKKVISGTIQEINLGKNLLVLKPRLFPRIINREFAAYFVYVINPATLQPAVKISLL